MITPLRASHRRPAVLVVAATYYRGHQLYDQRLSDELARIADVTYVDPPVCWGRGKWRPRVEIVANGERRLRVLSPVTIPWARRRGFEIPAGVILAAQIWMFALRRPIRDTRIVYVAAASTTRWLLPRRINVSLVKDDYLAGSELLGLSKQTLRTRFRRSMRFARKVVVVSPRLADTMLTRGLRAEVVPAGCYLPDFVASSRAFDGRGSGTAVFIGMLSDRIEFGLFRALLEAGIGVTTVGSLQGTFTKHIEYREILDHPLFTSLEPRYGSDLEEVIMSADIGLIPYEDTVFNQASFPLKTFEYLACGKPVVSSNLSALRWLDSDLVAVAADVADFVANAHEMINLGVDPATAQACRDLAAQNTWGERAKHFARLLEL